jgi:outer membrane protein TolC
MNKINVFLMCLVTGFIAPIPAYSMPESLLEDSLTLKQCIEIALRNSHEISIASGNVSKAKIGVKDARSGFLPELYLSGGYNVNDTYDKFEWNENHYSLYLSASITPFTSGRTLINVARAGASFSSARESYSITETSLILDVIRKYYNLLQARELLELRKESIFQKRKDLEFAQARFDLGLAPKADILKAGVAVVSTQVDSLQAEGDLELARAELNDAMGILLDHPTEIKPVKFVKEEIPDLDTCLVVALQERPEITRQKANLSINNYNLRLAHIERLPTFTITGSYDVYADKFAFEGLPVNRANLNENSDWRFNVGLSFPIFDGGVKSRAIQEARIDLNNAELNYLDLEKEVNLEVKLAYLSLITTSKKVELTEKQVNSAEESYNMALGRYKADIAPITEVVDAGVALSSSKVNHTKAIYDCLLAKDILKKSIGQLYY